MRKLVSAVLVAGLLFAAHAVSDRPQQAAGEDRKPNAGHGIEGATFEGTVWRGESHLGMWDRGCSWSLKRESGPSSDLFKLSVKLGALNYLVFTRSQIEAFLSYLSRRPESGEWIYVNRQVFRMRKDGVLRNNDGHAYKAEDVVQFKELLTTALEKIRTAGPIPVGPK